MKLIVHLQEQKFKSDLNNAKALNEAMHQLENEVHLENSIKQSSNYINEDPASQNAYNDALQKSEEYH